MSGLDPAVLQIALALPLPHCFDYLPPPGLEPRPDWVGRRVRVPFGTKSMIGVIASVSAHPNTTDAPVLRCVDQILDEAPVFDSELWLTLNWAAGYYHRPLGEVLMAALPGPLRAGQPLPDTLAIRWCLNEAGRTARQGLRAGSRPRALAELLQQPREESTLDAVLPGWRTALRALRRRDLVESVKARAALGGSMLPAPTLNAEQQQAADAVVAALGDFRPFLLDGVTGSGKTEVYLAAIEACLARGRQALVLVPEIGLTPQALRRYGERLPVAVEALHSGLSETARARAWTAMARGEARVLIGTRSAVFTPLPEPGLIIVDEEHDASYKQQDGFRYHARDLALVRGKSLQVPVLMGSATPALESLLLARRGRYAHLRLSRRAGGANPPSSHVVDVRSLPLRHGLSTPLLEALRLCLARGEQALVFRNRRGYAPCLLCHDCGWSAVCLRCERALTLHGRARLLCHHCGARQQAPSACPDCGGLGLVPQGAGTERLEQALAEAFPDSPLVRVDRETTQHRDALQKHFDRLGDAAGILVGTQMLAKGHDLPRLTLVAVASIDDGLFSADFRASERLAQLLVQVAGRAGRAERPGQVWVQTHHPDHPLLRQLLGGGYPAFADAALSEREAAAFPPFAHLALLRVEANGIDVVDAFLAAARQRLVEHAGEGVEVYAPMPAPMPLRAGRHRAQLLLASARRPALQAMLQAAMPELHALRAARKVRWSMDVDPVDLY